MRAGESKGRKGEGVRGRKMKQEQGRGREREGKIVHFRTGT